MNGNEQDVQAFESRNVRGGTALPLFTGLVGFSCAAAAIGTAALPASVGGVGRIASLLERLGLDEGPLALFGLSLCALAATMWRAGRATAAARASEEASLVGQQVLGDLGAQAAVLASLRAELGATRMEVAELRQESGASFTDGGNAASSPLFRMAASLDQLGANVSTRIDATRAEFLGAVEGLTARVEELKEASIRGGASRETSEQRELIEGLREAQLRSASENRDRFESVRSELTGLIEAVASLARPIGSSAAEPAVDETQPTMRFEEIASAEFEFEFGGLTAEDLPQIAPPAPFGLPLQASDQPLPPAAAAPLPPAELADDPFEAEVSTSEAPSIAQEPTPAEATSGPFEDDALAAPGELLESDRADAFESIETEPTFGPELTGVSPTCTDEPRPPLPVPSEGLELLDEMQEDRARPEDLTPPLFPELGPGPLDS